MTLTGKQKRYLRSLAHHEKPLFQIGKNGVTENFIAQVDDVMIKRELIKISVLQNCLEDKDSIAKALESATGAEIVQIMGNTIVLYRESDEHKEIELP
ncbi:ribosome assembly RNA-binding protein YhbY [Jeotgalicoccus huakuii]|uniref:ribosome assembly RNA-binding protein YhbY n=1 Tax=Jeotgalicoccus TaxID=227979 RepID=UPI00040D5DC5|nr:MULTISPECIES: ribosome assembly RNA-binding protein YhbY [Jeotgalicoccus]MCK1977489.1 ribosome assembly RNA-binding protein YhbY [Jeotgalicoccus huakuii]QQD85534.1 ribosome assembly RNA-binding protein YhbY [Jeotgalicoccus sp. ATCC 8456]